MKKIIVIWWDDSSSLQSLDKQNWWDQYNNYPIQRKTLFFLLDTIYWKNNHTIIIEPVDEIKPVDETDYISITNDWEKNKSDTDTIQYFYHLIPEFQDFLKSKKQFEQDNNNDECIVNLDYIVCDFESRYYDQIEESETTTNIWNIKKYIQEYLSFQIEDIRDIWWCTVGVDQQLKKDCDIYMISIDQKNLNKKIRDILQYDDQKEKLRVDNPNFNDIQNNLLSKRIELESYRKKIEEYYTRLWVEYIIHLESIANIKWPDYDYNQQYLVEIFKQLYYAKQAVQIFAIDDEDDED